MKNTIIYLFGFPATGKYTIAKEICDQADVILIDNQTINHPVFNVLDLNSKKLPPRVWENCKAIWHAVFDSIIHIAPADNNYVLTNVLVNDDPEDEEWFEAVNKMTLEKDAAFVPVRLLVSLKENQKRILEPSRKEKLKTMKPDLPKEMADNHTVLNTDHPNEMTLDVSDLPPKEAARRILEHAQNCH